MSQIEVAQDRVGRVPGSSLAPSGFGAGPVLGLDIGGTKLAAGVVTSAGEILGFSRVPTPPGRHPKEVLEALFRTGRRSLELSGAQVQGVGIACGGPLDRIAGTVFAPPHLPLWHGVPVADLAASEFGLPAFLENDAACGAVAEYEFGVGRGNTSATLVFLTISTGIGGGFIIDGKLYLGAAGNGGEPGHITVVPGGRPCLCGRVGCLEAYCSGTAIAARAVERMSTGTKSILATEAQVTAERVFHATQQGDPLAMEVWAETVELLGQGLTDLINMLEPDICVLGGGVTRAGAALLDPVVRTVRREAMGPAAAKVQILLAGLGDAVCAAGAGAIALAGVKGKRS